MTIRLQVFYLLFFLQASPGFRLKEKKMLRQTCVPLRGVVVEACEVFRAVLPKL